MLEQGLSFGSSIRFDAMWTGKTWVVWTPDHEACRWTENSLRETDKSWSHRLWRRLIPPDHCWDWEWWWAEGEEPAVGGRYRFLVDQDTQCWQSCTSNQSWLWSLPSLSLPHVPLSLDPLFLWFLVWILLEKHQKELMTPVFEHSWFFSTIKVLEEWKLFIRAVNKIWFIFCINLQQHPWWRLELWTQDESRWRSQVSHGESDEQQREEEEIEHGTKSLSITSTFLYHCYKYYHHYWHRRCS